MEEKLLFDQTLKRIEFFFRYGGINIKSGSISYGNYIMSRMVLIFNFLWLNTDLAGAIYWFIDGVQTDKDFLSLTYIAPCIFLTSLANIKGLLLVVNEGKAHKLIKNLRNFEKKDIKRPQSKEKDDIISKERNFLNIVINVINCLYISAIVTFACSPIAIIAVKYYQTGELELVLQFMILYPFDPFQKSVWPFVWLHQVMSEVVVALNYCSADYFFFTCCTYIRIQFKLLHYDIENLFPTQRDSQQFLDNDEFKAKFSDMIRFHQDLIDSTEILEMIYSKSTLLNFVSSSMVICLTGFNVTMVNDVAIVVSFLSFLSMSLFQIFFLCFFADLLMTASMEVTDAVYKSQWYMAEPSVGKKLLLMQKRGQKPCKLTAFGFADVNLNSFMRVLSTAWSYFALLQTIYGD